MPNAMLVDRFETVVGIRLGADSTTSLSSTRPRGALISLQSTVGTRSVLLYFQPWSSQI
jgi:hypothetical protein